MKIFAILYNDKIYFFNESDSTWTQQLGTGFFTHQAVMTTYERVKNTYKDSLHLEFEVNHESEIIPYIKSQWTELWL